MIIAIDFDGTCVTHQYPRIGKDVGAVKVLKQLVSQGHGLILYTCRDGESLKEAVKWFEVNGIQLFAVNIHPDQTRMGLSNKCLAELYIDDRGLGCPIKYDYSLSYSGFVCWKTVREMLIAKGCLKG